METIDVLGRIHGAQRRLQQEVFNLREELRSTRQLLGSTIEVLGAHFPELAHDLGLTNRPEDLLGATAPP